MDFDLSEEQRLLKESVDRLIGDRYAFEQRKSYSQNAEGWSRELWAQFAELGLLGLPFAEQHGGSAGGLVETMIVMEAFGRALAYPAPIPNPHTRPDHIHRIKTMGKEGNYKTAVGEDMVLRRDCGLVVF